MEVKENTKTRKKAKTFSFYYEVIEWGKINVKRTDSESKDIFTKIEIFQLLYQIARKTYTSRGEKVMKAVMGDNYTHYRLMVTAANKGIEDRAIADDRIISIAKALGLTIVPGVEVKDAVVPVIEVKSV